MSTQPRRHHKEVAKGSKKGPPPQTTRPVNPPGAEPLLTEEQVWKGLEYKARNPEPFVPMISASKTVFDEGKKLARELTMANSNVTIKKNIETHAPLSLSIERHAAAKTILSTAQEHNMYCDYFLVLENAFWKIVRTSSRQKKCNHTLFSSS
ncbi:hypothetical protein C8R45DRAFT_1091550 [Mycena sanguinolenta]|nr:hypothetical protein C8R45DRAFT_1091550 [Mycena sanguinolenta]